MGLNRFWWMPTSLLPCPQYQYFYSVLAHKNWLMINVAATIINGERKEEDRSVDEGNTLIGAFSCAFRLYKHVLSHQYDAIWSGMRRSQYIAASTIIILSSRSVNISIGGRSICKLTNETLYCAQPIVLESCFIVKQEYSSTVRQDDCVLCDWTWLDWLNFYFAKQYNVGMHVSSSCCMGVGGLL